MTTKEQKTSTEDQFQIFASIVFSSNDAIEALTLDGKINIWNKGCEKLYGYSSAEMEGKSILLVYPEDHIDEFQFIISKIKNGEHVEPYVTQRKRKDGVLIDVAVSASPLKDKKDNIIGISVIARLVAGLERITQAFSYARSLIEASLDPLVTISPEEKITDVNEATVKITGISREKLIGSDFFDYFTDPEKAREGYKLVFLKGQ